MFSAKSIPECLFCASILLLASISASNQQQASNLGTIQNCHLRELELCSIGAASLFQNPNGVPIGEQEIKRQCEMLDESADCFEEYSDKCMTQNQQSLVKMFGRQMIERERNFCKNGTKFNDDYKENAPCLRRVQRRYQALCMTDFQVGFESIHKQSDMAIKLSIGCCNVNRLVQCLLPRIEEMCGSSAVQLIAPIFNETLTGTIIRRVCKDLDPNSSRCLAVLPKTGTKPKADRAGTSAISRIISSYVGIRTEAMLIN